MNKRFIEELVGREPRIPVAINIVAKRIRQLFRGDRAMVDTHLLTDPVDISIKEFLDGRLDVKGSPSEKK